MNPAVIPLPSRMVSLESVSWTMRAITPSSRLRVIQSSLAFRASDEPVDGHLHLQLELAHRGHVRMSGSLVSSKRRMTFPEVDKRRARLITARPSAPGREGTPGAETPGRPRGYLSLMPRDIDVVGVWHGTPYQVASVSSTANGVIVACGPAGKHPT